MECLGMGIDLNNQCLCTLQFANDQAVISNDRDDMEYMVRKLIEEYAKWGLTVNTQRTKYLYIRSNAENLVKDDNKEISTCKEYKYLGTTFNREGTDDQEINIRLTQSRRIVACLNGILCNNNICAIKT